MKKILLTILAIIIWAVLSTMLMFVLFEYKLHSLFAGGFIGIIATLSAFWIYDYLGKRKFKNPFKRLWVWLRYKNHNRYYFKTAGSGCLEKCPINETVRIGSVCCQECSFCVDKNGIQEDCIWIKCEHLKTKRSYNPLNWLKKLFGILVIALLFASCSVYVNCNFNKVPKYKTTQQDSTVLQINEYWF